MSNISDENNKDNLYVRPKDFESEVRDYYFYSQLVEEYDGDKNTKDYRILVRKKDKYAEKCGLSLLKIVKGLSKNGRFSGYTQQWKEEMVNDALTRCIKALMSRKFDLSKKINPFSYFNKIAWREFIRRIKLENKLVDTHMRFIDEHINDYIDGLEDNQKVYRKKTVMEKMGDFYDEDQALN